MIIFQNTRKESIADTYSFICFKNKIHLNIPDATIFFEIRSNKIILNSSDAIIN
jgi:hypothetical protein